ncbi:MAG: hypothetical protein IPM82_30015 [Saprospiraceae bacterium]|nr:hypothetical protein [Saprospiraceae bacterium]
MEIVKQNLLFWLKFELWQIQKMHDFLFDLDITAILVGLCKLGFHEIAIKLPETMLFRNRIPYTRYSLLGVLLYLIEHHKEQVSYFLTRHKKRIIESSAEFM